MWDALAGNQVRILKKHQGPVNSVAFSPDGRLIVSGGADNTLIAWDAVAGNEVRTLRGHQGPVNSVAFSPDGRLIVSGSNDHTLKLWSAQNAKELQTLQGHRAAVTAVIFSPDGRSVVSGAADGVIKHWSLSKEIHTFSGHKAPISSLFVLSISNKTRLISFSSDGEVGAWNLSDGKGKLGVGSKLAFSTVTRADAVKFSPDGRFILAYSGGEKHFRLLEVATGKEFQKSSGVEVVRSLPSALSRDGRFALSGTGNSLKLWDVSTGRNLQSFDGHTDKITAVAFSSDGRFALSGADDALRLWDLASGQELRRFSGHAEGVNSATFSPDGRFLLSGGNDNLLKLWDVAAGKAIRTFGGPANPKKTIPGFWGNKIIYSVAISPDGQFALSGGGKAAIFGGSDGALVLWEIATGKQIRTFVDDKKKEKTRPVKTVAFSPDGQFALSGNGDGELQLWDVATGKLIRSFEAEKTERGWFSSNDINSAVFSTDGRLILSGGENRLLQIWDAATGELKKSLSGHTGTISSVAFSPDGLLALSSSEDGTTRIWDVKAGQELARRIASPGGPEAQEGEWLAITPKGFFAASPKGANMLAVVREVETYSIMQFYEHLARPDLVAERLKGDPEGKYRSAANVLNLESILESGPAPKLERLLDREKREGGKAELAVRLTDLGGGIGEKVIWRVNGGAQGATSAPGLGGPVRPGRYVVMQQTLNFDPSQRTEVEVVAYNGKGLLATLPLSFTIDPVFGPLDKPKPRLYVLAVGVDKYLKEDWRLSNAVNDATTIADALKAVGGAFFGKGNVEVKEVVDEEATERGIGQAFEALAAKVQPQDVFILYLSGHGRAIAGSGSGTGWFFLPQNLDFEHGQTVAANAISSKTLEGWLSTIQASKSVIVLDACRVGSIRRAQGRQPRIGNGHRAIRLCDGPQHPLGGGCRQGGL